MADGPQGRTVRLGIVGARGQGGFYARLIAEGRVPHLTLGALSGREATAAFAAESFPDVRFFPSIDAMLDSGCVDAVVTTVPHYLHAEVAEAALERGLHVLVEKPLGVYTKQVQRMLDAAASHPDLVVGAMFNMRANPLWARLKAVIDAGEIGRLRRGTWVITNWFRPQRYYDKDAWRGTWGGEGGGVINHAAHQIDLWQWLCGTPRTVYAKVPFGFAHAIDVEDDVTAVLNYGREGTGVFITDATIESIIRGTVDWGDFSTTEVVEGTSSYGVNHAQVLENFARAILFGEPLIAPVADGLDAVRLSNAPPLG